MGVEILILTTYQNVESELINVTREITKKILVPDRNLPKCCPIVSLGEQILPYECIARHPRYLEPSLTSSSRLLPSVIVLELPLDETSRGT